MQLWEISIRLLLAVLIGIIIGVERERKNRPAGTRTHVLVCVGSALIAIIESMNLEMTLALNTANADSGVAINMGRMCAQVVSGVGFLGAGTIFMSQKKIAGLTTAASLWCAACLGLAAGLGYYEIAGFGAGVVIVTLTLMQRVVRVNQVKHLEIKYTQRVQTQSFITSYLSEVGVKILDVDFHVESKGKEKTYTNLYTLVLPSKAQMKDLVMSLSENVNILGVRTKNI